MLHRQTPGGRGKAEEHITSRPPAAGSPRKTLALIASGIAMALTLPIFDGLGVSFGVGLLPALLRGMLIVLIGGAIGNGVAMLLTKEAPRDAGYSPPIAPPHAETDHGPTMVDKKRVPTADEHNSAPTAEHEMVLAFLERNGRRVAGNPEEEDILADIAAAGCARKDGDAYVYTGRRAECIQVTASSPERGPPPLPANSAGVAEWHVIHDGKELGPMSLAGLTEKAGAGEIQADDLIKQTGGLWTKAQDFGFLQQQFLLKASRARAIANLARFSGIWLSKKTLITAACLACVLVALGASIVVWSNLKASREVDRRIAEVEQGLDVERFEARRPDGLRLEAEERLETQRAQQAANDARPYLDRARASYARGQHDEAIKAFTEAIRLNPTDALVFCNRGRAWDEKSFKLVSAGFGPPPFAKATAHDLRAASDCDDNAIKDYGEAIRLNPKDSSAYFYRAQALSRKKDYDSALGDYSAAIQLDGNSLGAYAGRADAWMNQKHYDRAIKDFDEAIRLLAIEQDKQDDPLLRASLYRNRGSAWKSAGMAADRERGYFYDRAVKDYEEAMRLNPVWLLPQLDYSFFAWELATSPEESARDGKLAMQMARKLCEITDWKRGWELEILAAAFAEAGQFDEAVHYQARALEHRRGGGATEDECRSRLKLYRQGKPFREKR
jgi:tetratricopeptide (TPR) repeat protein